MPFFLTACFYPSNDAITKVYVNSVIAVVSTVVYLLLALLCFYFYYNVSERIDKVAMSV